MLLCLGCQVLLCRIKCHIRTKYLMSLKCSAIRLCLSIVLFSCKFDCKMQSTCTAGKCNCIFAVNFLSDKDFCFIDIFAC